MSVVNETDRVCQQVRPAQGSRALWWAASGAWTALILFSSTSIAAEYCERGFVSIYGSTLGKDFSSGQVYDWIHFLADKGLHVTLFLVLGTLLWRVFSAARWRRLSQVAVLGLLVGTSSELLQILFPGRDPAIRDVMINLAGTLLGGTLCALRARPE